MSESFKDLDLDKIKNTFPYYPSLIYVLGPLILFYVVIDGFLTSYIVEKEIRIIIYVSLIVIWISFWFYHRINPSKNTKDKIGIVICIKTENDKQRIRLKNDFVSRMGELIDENNLNEIIKIVPLSEYHTEKYYNIMVDYSKLDNKDRDLQSKHPTRKKWVKISKKIRGNFYIWGTIKERIEKEPIYIFDIKGRVIHPPLNTNLPNPFEIAFNKVWTKRILFKEIFEASGFIFAADVIMLGVKYIVGLTAFISKDAISALKIHEGLLKDFDKYDPLPPNLKEVKIELVSNLIDECQVLSRKSYIDKDEIKAKDYLNKSFKFDPNNYDGIVLKSLYDFVYDNNPMESIKSCYKAKKYAKEDGTWKYNLAFLLMHLERFDEALDWYKDIISNSFKNEDGLLEDVYEFNIELVKSNPKDIQSFFILGYLKYHKSNNYPESLDYLTTFVKQANNDKKYICLIKEATKLVKNIKKEMSLE